MSDDHTNESPPSATSEGFQNHTTTSAHHSFSAIECEVPEWLANLNAAPAATPVARLSPDLAAAHDFLKRLDPTTDTFCFQTFDDCKTPGHVKRRHLARTLNGTLEQHADELSRLSSQGAGVFVTVQATDGNGRRDGNITRIRAVYQEADAPGAKVPPLAANIEVESSPGKFHRYWLITPETAPDADGFAGVMGRLVQDWDSDPNAKDIARVLRLPGFAHQKDPANPFMAQVTGGSGVARQWSEIVVAFPPLEVRRKSASRALKRAHRAAAAALLGGESLTVPEIAPVSAPADWDEVKSLLACLDPNMGRADWLRVLMALNSTGRPEAYPLALEWSRPGATFNDGDFLDAWESLTIDPDGVTLGSLYAMAMKAGWQRPAPDVSGLFGAMAPDATDADNDPDNHRNAPQPDEACLYGLVGDVARAGGDTTEANPFAIAANFIAFMGCAVGRSAFMPVGNTWHHPNQFMLHVGRSGRGRKGDAVALVSRIERALRGINADAAPQVHRGGLSSREGLVFLIHDGFTEGKTVIPPVVDKRLLVIESEFANVLQQSKREGNTLSAALRDCWDGVSLKPATKSSRLWATDPHLGMTCAVTPGELLALMASRDLTNGFANRFMVFWAERTRMLAFPQATPQTVVDALAQRVLKVLEFCGALQGGGQDTVRMEFALDARTRYEALYHGELNDNSSGERITALIERRAPMLLRLAILFALCDLTHLVQVHHIEGALAWVRYSVDSVKFIFGSVADEVAVAEVNDTAQKIVAFLSEREQATRWELTSECFKGHTTKSRIDAALDELLSCNPARIVMKSEPRPKDKPGTPTKIYKLAAKCAKSAKAEHPRGFGSI